MKKILLFLMLISTRVVAMNDPTADPNDLEAAVALMAKIRTCFSPSFSPDGKRLAFVSDLNGVPQVWTVATEGGWPELVTAFYERAGDRGGAGRRQSQAASCRGGICSLSRRGPRLSQNTQSYSLRRCRRALVRDAFESKLI